MQKNIEFKQLFVYTGSLDKCHYSTFSSGINIITGKNTSGKSTILLSLLYAIGINDIKEELNEILREKPTFRLDFSINNNNIINDYSIIREPIAIHIKEPSGKINHFYGIDADHSAEHVKLKNYINNLFGFKLVLEQKGELKPAPLECAFLPYYVSQAVGWVYLRESFSNLSFYKNFTEDFLDYYLGIQNTTNRIEKSSLVSKKNQTQNSINSLRLMSNDQEITSSIYIDESFSSSIQDYIHDYRENIKNLEDERTNNIYLCNELATIENHKKIVTKTKRSLNSQSFNNQHTCPACMQPLMHSLVGMFKHYQKVNDNESLLLAIQEKAKVVQSNLNTSSKKIEKLEGIVTEQYEKLTSKKIDNLTIDEWIKNKTNVELYKKINKKISAFEENLRTIETEISNIKSDSAIERDRSNASRIFKNTFKPLLNELKVKEPHESKYLELYKIKSFPYQGVELLKTVLAYHYAFNKLISKNNSIHRLPFLLDAILKEDMDQDNEPLILNFAIKNAPEDTQTFLSVANSKKAFQSSHSSRIEYISNLLPANSKIITLGEGQHERCFFSSRISLCENIYKETIEIIMHTQ